MNVGVDWKELCSLLLENAESTILQGHESMSDPEKFEAACPFCGAASNMNTKEPHAEDCVGELARSLFEGENNCDL